MPLSALQPFLISLGDDFRLTVRDYERISLALQAGGKWTMEQFRVMLLSLLAKDVEQEDVFLRRFNSFFKSVPESAFSDDDINRILDELQGLAHGRTKDVKPEQSLKPHKPVRIKQLETKEEARKRCWWLLPFVPLVILVLIWVLKPVFFPLTPDSGQRMSLPEDTIKKIESDVLFEYIPYIDKIEQKIYTTPYTFSFYKTVFIALKRFTSPVEYIQSRYEYEILAIIFLIFIIIIYLKFIWISRKIPKEKPPFWDEKKKRLFSLSTIGGKAPLILDDKTLDQISDSLGYFQSREAGKKLDVSASIKSSLEHGGIPVLEFHKLKQIRTLLILEDSFAEALAWNNIAEELDYGLRQRGVSVLYGSFQGSPEIFQTKNGSVHRLDDLEDQRREFLLLIFTDGKWTFSNKNKFVIESLSRWPMLAWMDLRSPRLWDEILMLPVLHNIPIYPATAKGTVLAVRRFLTEQGNAKDFSENAVNHDKISSYSSGNLYVYLEYLLGDALIWGQECAMFQPVSPGLAHSLRLKFHNHLPFHRIELLYALPDTISNASGIHFSDEVKKVLRKGFMKRRSKKEQEDVLNFILEKIKEAEPEDIQSPAHLVWETRKEIFLLDLENKDNYKRLAQLAEIESFKHSISAELEKFGFQDDPDKIPLRIKKPKNKNALQRLERINDNFNINVHDR